MKYPQIQGQSLRNNQSSAIIFLDGYSISFKRKGRADPGELLIKMLKRVSNSKLSLSPPKHVVQKDYLMSFATCFWYFTVSAFTLELEERRLMFGLVANVWEGFRELLEKYSYKHIPFHQLFNTLPWRKGMRMRFNLGQSDSSQVMSLLTHPNAVLCLN